MRADSLIGNYTSSCLTAIRVNMTAVIIIWETMHGTSNIDLLITQFKKQNNASFYRKVIACSIQIWLLIRYDTKHQTSVCIRHALVLKSWNFPTDCIQRKAIPNQIFFSDKPNVKLTTDFGIHFFYLRSSADSSGIWLRELLTLCAFFVDEDSLT